MAVRAADWRAVYDEEKRPGSGSSVTGRRAQRGRVRAGVHSEVELEQACKAR